MKQKTVKGQIADASGHTDFTGTLDEAMETIMDMVKNAGKWAYLNGTPYIFNSFDPIEEKQARDLLNSVEEPSFVLTGKLQGGNATLVKNRNVTTTVKGKTVYRKRLISSPLSSFLVGKNCAQFAVVMKNNHGKTFVDIVASNYKGGKRKLARHKGAILTGVTNLLS